MTAVSYSAMSAQQLLDAYNALAPTPRHSKFQSKGHAIVAIRRLHADRQDTVEDEAPEAPKAEAPGDTTPETLDAASEPATAPNGAFGNGTGRRAQRLDKTIVLLREENPRRLETDAYRHFEAMRGNPTIREYLDKFGTESKKANQWLWNTVRDGFVKVASHD